MEDVSKVGSIELHAGDQRVLLQRALALEWVTIAWMSIESIATVSSGINARSVSLTAFGLDSVTELASPGAVV